MDTVDPARFALAFVFVVGLIGLMAFAMRRYNIGHKLSGGNLFSKIDENARLHLVETRYLDARRRLVLVRRDDKEHLLLLSDGRELVIESGITPAMIKTPQPESV